MRILNKLIVVSRHYFFSTPCRTQRMMQERGSNNEINCVSNHKAFTLLEVMVALAIMAIALTTLFGSQSGSLSLATEAKFATNASLLADLKFAELESGNLAPVDAQGDFGKDFPGYSWKIEIRDAGEGLPELPIDLQNRLRRVDLSIFWAKQVAPLMVTYYMRPKDVP